jgi:hypothetical protein
MWETIWKTGLTVIVSALVGGAITYVVAVVKLNKRVADLEKWRRFIQQDTDDSMEERKLLLCGVLACLKGLAEKGCNGPVTESIEELEEYINRQAHRPRSYTKGAAS